MVNFTKEQVHSKNFEGFSVRYYLCKKTLETEASGEISAFGCLLEKLRGGAILDRDSALLSESEDVAAGVVKRLYEAEVTPMSLVEVIDDVLAKEEAEHYRCACAKVS